MTTRAQIVAAARRWIGTPYLHQASLLQSGCDCLGLVRGVWREAIGDEPEETPPYAADWSDSLDAERLLDAAHRHFQSVPVLDFREGDVIAFRFLAHAPARHLGVASSRTHMIHAHSGACVAEVPIGAHWRKRVVAAFAFPGVVD